MRTLAAFTLPVLCLALLAASPAAPAAAQAEKEIPIIVEEEAGGAPEAGKKAEIVAAPKAAAEGKKKAAKKAAEKTEVQTGEKAPASAPAAGESAAPAAEAKTVRSGESLGKLVKTFVKYRPDIAIDPACYAEGDAGFDAARAEALKADITTWKKLRLEAKAAKGKDAARFEKKYREVRDLEEKILADYGKGGAAAGAEGKGEPAEGEAAGAKDADATAGKAALADAAKTPEAKRILERAGKGAEAPAEGPKAKRPEDDEDRRAAKEDAEGRLEEVRKEREGSRYMPAKIRWRPSRVLFNRLEPGGADRAVFTIRNVGRSPFEGAIVAIEDWITVAPPTVLIEPNAEIEIDVQVKAPDKKNVRAEGSIEIRAVGESSRRVPVVLRTARK